MRSFLRTTLSAALVVGPILSACPAGATPPTGYGFDGTPHVLIGGGADPSYRGTLDVTDLWATSPGCAPVSTIGATLGQCTTVASAETNTLGNYQHDSITQAFPAGSSQGLASLNGSNNAVTYAGAVNPLPAYLGSGATGPNVDFARSSRDPKTTGGNAIGGNELAVDTFWGFAQDAIEIVTFNARGAQLQALGGSALTPAELYHIWNCDYTQWSQVPSLGIAPGSATDGPIVAWQMSSLNSGTIGSLANFLIASGGAPAGWSPNGQSCSRKLTATGNGPSNDDVKQLINDPAALSSSPTSVDNPENWIWWSSFGILSSFPYLAAPVRNATIYQSIPAPVNGILPSPSTVIANTYPITRTLYHVTRKQDADCAKTGGNCDFNGNPGPVINGAITDLNVAGATSGVGGAVRELTRFICRGNANQHTVDPFTGVNYFSEITSSINTFGFTTIPFSLKTPGSRCRVRS